VAVLILTPRQVSELEDLSQAATALGWSVFQLRNWRIKPIHNETTIAVYGEHLFVEAIAQQLGLSLLEPPVDWLPQLPVEYRLREVRLSELKLLEESWFPAFIKPADDKCFSAQVFDTQNDFPSTDLLPPTTPILISEPVIWEVEFRCFIREKQCATLSVYKRYGESVQTTENLWLAGEGEISEANSFIKSLLIDVRVSIPPSVVIDIGRIQGRGWSVIEANPSWASGIYGCNPYEVLYTIARGCRVSSILNEEDKKWVIIRNDDI
jgi:hypothetical protein